ncbi:MAG TPA: pirin family protein [Alphaproteobacteria bacterium]|nr:pirin family protein [Alphaproteobacteria bacterium]HOO50605.1 pirin family protein [Alphaproteobacteria bacterium]
MIKTYPYKDLGTADYGWLNAHYHFSFAHYHNPSRIHFGKLRVINDDRIAPNTGFDTHPHQDMEIITFVRSGAITHKDSEGHEGRTAAGDVQVMSAGTGIFHSEANKEDTETTLYQIWIFPREKGVTPRWDAARFADRKANDTLPLLVSGRAEDNGKNALYIHQDARILGGQMDKGHKLTQEILEQGYLLVSKGEITLDGQKLEKGDGAEITNQGSVEIEALSEAEIILIDVPK